MQISTNIASFITHSSTPTMTKTNSPSFVINDLLTANDKKLVDTVTANLPSTSSGLHEVNQLAFRIALDRDTGTLSGEIDENYINKLIAEQSSHDHAETIQLSALQKTLELIKQERGDFFKRTTVL